MSAAISIFLFSAIFGAVFLLGSRIGKRVPQRQTALPENAFGSLTASLAGVIPQASGKRKRIQTELSDAGMHHRNAMINFLSMRNAAVMGWILLAGMFFAFTDLQSLGKTTLYLYGAVATGGLVIVYGLPRIMLSSLAVSRKRKLENALPDALDMIAMSVEGGLPLERSLSRVASQIAETHPALGSELAIIARQAETGSFETAIQKFGQRTSIEDVTAWSAIVRQNQKTGGDIVGSLREYADRMRANRRQRLEKASSTASIKLLLPVVLFLAPPVFIVLIGPGLLDFRDFILREQTNHTEIIREANVPGLERLVTGQTR